MAIRGYTDLLLRGEVADRSVKDDLDHGTAEGAAEHLGQLEVRDFLRSLGA